MGTSSKHKDPGGDSAPEEAKKRASCVLVAEDDDDMRALLASTLRQSGYTVIECTDGLDLVEHLSSLLGSPGTYPHIDLVVSDIRMPWATGLTRCDARKTILDTRPLCSSRPFR